MAENRPSTITENIGAGLMVFGSILGLGVLGLYLWAQKTKWRPEPPVEEQEN
ncbi:MAG: hypothetical protein PHE15_02875 [Dehalococcoidales bacterium]|nr:hypothetical protein [Dehalococcoidales bacterium]